MKRIHKGNVFFSLIIALLTFICAFSVLCPQIEVTEFVPQGKPAYVAYPSEAQMITAGKINTDGQIEFAKDWDVAVVQFLAKNINSSALVINFSEPTQEGKRFSMQKTIDGTYQDQDDGFTYISPNIDKVCIQLEQKQYAGVRLWFRDEYKIKNVEFYDTPVDAVNTKLPISTGRYVAVAIITVFAFLLTLFIAQKFNTVKQLGNYFSKNGRQLTITLSAIIAAISLAIIIEYLLRLIIGKDSVGSSFNMASAATIGVLLVFAAVIATGWKDLANKPEKAMAILIFALGAYIILTQSFSHTSWDVDSHYPRALENSFYGMSYFTESDLGICYNYRFPLKGLSLAESNASIENLNLLGEQYYVARPSVFRISYLPSGVAIAVARLFGASFHTRYICGVFASLLVYSALCYFALKKMNRGKMIMASVAMLPTSIYLAANYSADFWVNGFAFLGIAYFVSELEQQNKPMKTLDIVIMCFAFMMASMPKLIYALIFGVPLFMRKTNWQKRARLKYYSIVIAFLVFTVALFFIKSITMVSGDGDSRGGSNIDPTGQIIYIFKNPVDYTKILLKFLVQYFSINNAMEYCTQYVYQGHNSLYYLSLLIIAFCTLTDKGPFNKFKGMHIIRLLAIAFYFAMGCIIATALYVDFNSVGNSFINGCQARYMVPLLPVLLLLISNPGFNILKNKTVYNSIVLTMLFGVSFYTTFTLVALPMM